MKLWEKGYTLNSLIEDFTVGNDRILDKKLIEYDCLASIAHAKTLGKAGILTEAEVNSLETVFLEIIEINKKGEFAINNEDEDCHTAIENYLVLKLGDTGKKIHAARSRNDQVLTALRLFYKDEMNICRDLSSEYLSGISDFQSKYGDIQFPGYTHTRKAMPSSINIWAGAFVDSMLDNQKLLKTVYSIVDRSPSGTGAGYGIPLDIDQYYSMDLLDFENIHLNPIYAQISRGKYESMILHLLSQIMFDLNKLASDLIFFSMPEIGYFELPDEVCTGSSIMPQKKNPDLLEIMRGNYHVVISCEHQVKTVTSNLLSGYNRDIQLTKEPVMKSFEIVEKSLEIAIILFEQLKVNKKRCKEAMTPELFAAERAYELVKKGMPFREAYKKIADELS